MSPMFMCVFAHAHDFISERLMISEMLTIQYMETGDLFEGEKREKKRKERERRERDVSGRYEGGGCFSTGAASRLG